MKSRHFLHTLVLMFLCFGAKGQTLDDARSWYLEGRYAEALPVFRAEYLKDKDNASLNQWLGVSLYKTGRLSEAEQYLTFASKKRIPEAYFYRGELLAKMYRFGEAEAEFKKYQRVNRKNDEALKKLERAREEAGKLQRAVNRTEDVQIIDSMVVPKSDFLSAYNLSLSSGTIMAISDFFNQPQITDKTLYMNERRDKIYYSQEDRTMGLNLFTMEKLIDSFDNEKQLPEIINDSGNQAYPFVMSDGLTIYFASTGHQSFGGFDLYVTRYNLASDSYLTPNQLNMPFNSPFNDYLMVIDEEKEVGWFTSDRYQPENLVCVYTFIPNERVSLLESEDVEYLSNRAKISSIADTWREDVDYTSLRAMAQRETVLQGQTEKDFAFVINDKLTYHTLSDFRNSRARSMYSQVMGLEKQLQTAKDELKEKRNQYANGGSVNNNGLSASILELEKQSESIMMDIERLKIQARNEEIRSNYN